MIDYVETTTTAALARVERPRLVGNEQTVPLVTGDSRRHVNGDYAASAPALEAVAAAVNDLLPWYSSVHRGAGYKSQVSTRIYERARQEVAAFFGARHDDTLIFTRHTTEAIHVLAASLPDDARVLSTAVEHHANLLPWRRKQVQYVPIPGTPDELLRSIDSALTAADGTISLVAVTGASNVTGEIWPLAEIAALAHRHGARVLVDAAQLAPHAPIDIAALEIDYLVLSAHKLYAPFGVGVLLGRRDWLEQATPLLAGGGAVQAVSLDEVVWRGLPDRHEAGTPNVIGAVALGVACRTLAAYGMERLAAEEAALYTHAWRRFSAIAGLELYSLWDQSNPHIGVLTFNLEGYHHDQLATILSAEYGISVRAGSFCAHPLVRYLVASDALAACESRASHSGAVRLSLGLGSTHDDIDYIADALTTLAVDGPLWHYEQCPQTGEFRPLPDSRSWPELSLSW